MTETQDKTVPPLKGNNPPENTGRYPKSVGPKTSDLADKRVKNLRENLMRRKQQARSRSEADDPA